MAHFDALLDSLFALSQLSRLLWVLGDKWKAMLLRCHNAESAGIGKELMELANVMDIRRYIDKNR